MIEVPVFALCFDVRVNHYLFVKLYDVVCVETCGLTESNETQERSDSAEEFYVFL